MGCDGGTIPRRNELVKVKKKPEKRDKASHLIFQWRYCNITQQQLERPIVTCGMGRLYNKSAIIEAIIDKNPLPSHIKSFKDVITLQLTKNPEFDEKAPTPNDTAPYICPVTGLEMSGKFKFLALWKCGCVMSERALKETKTKNCPKCQQSFDEIDVIILNPDDEDEIAMAKILGKRRRINKAELATKKAKI